jgi:hypothetical protein
MIAQTAGGAYRSLGIVFLALQTVAKAKGLASRSVAAKFACQRCLFVEHQLLYRQYGLHMPLIEGTKLCRFSIDYEPENTARKKLPGNSRGHGIVSKAMWVGERDAGGLAMVAE